jgi:hypothetical protein
MEKITAKIRRLKELDDKQTLLFLYYTSKEFPLEVCNQLRPISLTNIIMKIFEKLVLKQELSSLMKSVIGRDQFAY